MLLKSLIILSSNSFYFNPLAIPEIILSTRHPNTVAFITNLYNYAKITICLTYLRDYLHKKICGSLNLQSGVFSVNYAVMDTNNIALWVSVCVKNMNVKDFTLAAFLI